MEGEEEVGGGEEEGEDEVMNWINGEGVNVVMERCFMPLRRTKKRPLPNADSKTSSATSPFDELETSGRQRRQASSQNKKPPIMVSISSFILPSLTNHYLGI